MIQIRKCTFETNSSSTHSIAIPKDCDTSKLNTVGFGFGEFGWAFEEVDACDYLYTGIYDAFSKEEAEARVEKLKEILDRHGIHYTMKTPKFSDSGWFDSGYVDHAADLGYFIDELLAHDDFLLKYLEGGKVFTGNDNAESKQRAFVNRKEPTYEEYNWDTNETTIHHNPYYIGEGYDWYYKGN